LGSIRKIAINLGETDKKTKFTPPSSIKATSTLITSNWDDICPASFSNAGDFMMTSSSQNKGIHVNYSTSTNKDPPEGKTTAIIAVMRGEPKDGCHCHCNIKHYKQKLVHPVRQWFYRQPHLCEQRQAHTASLPKKAGSTVVEYFEWDLPDQA
jgi:hypothetical protein